MSQYRVLRNAETGEVVLPRAVWCQSYWCRLRGLMFRRDLPEDEGLLFVYGKESRLDTSIHMFFMAFAIATVWLDKEGRVVDKVLAKPWRPAYASSKPAQYIIEARPSLLQRVAVGDRLSFEA
jgi:uncharacterized membrane protein (UPF0127 family)